ncbi:MAG: ribosome biogenesis GTP-binding protein YsxC [Myxococcaceae bacterium]|nr:ribosome biogenesis GTP-binding protein YsxC [Myxococcaceae bacterium]MBH2006569.1 ribosome biogenesis GTP-binding protein YsxC [Myxococcaceae bacterium]
MEDLKLEKARFILSAPSVALLPQDGLPEMAVVGRSNVGKSSFLNYLANQKTLARVSKTPGRTQALNVFEARLKDLELRILDLPGLGYAQLSLEERSRLSDLISDYLNDRQPLKMVIHLLDCRRDPIAEDIRLSRQLRSHVDQYQAVLTKIDQIPVSKRKEARLRISQALQISVDDCLTVSAHSNLGRFEILETIYGLMAPGRKPNLYSI